MDSFIKSIALEELRAAGPARVRRRLEALVNNDVLGFTGAQQLWTEAFGGTLIAIPDRPKKKTHWWFGFKR